MGTKGKKSILRPKKSVHNNLKPNTFLKTRVYTLPFKIVFHGEISTNLSRNS